MPAPLPPLLARAFRYGDRTAIIDRQTSYSYKQLDEASANVAAALGDLAGSHVAFLITPGFDYVAVQWGIWRAGGVAVPLPLSHPPAELEYLVRDSEANILIADAASSAVAEVTAKATGARLLPTPHLTHPPHLSQGSWGPTPTRSRSAASRLARAAGASHPALILYTSGTTNRPKGVVTTHANITAQIDSLVTAWEWTSADRTLLVLPLHHVHGIINVVSCALWSGATLEMHPRFDAEATWDRLASGELTVFTAVPTIYHRLIQSWEASDRTAQQRRSAACRTLRLMMSGSAALPRLVLDKWQQISGHVLLERYGMTEVGMALANPLRGERRPGYVGQPLPGVTARIVDGELQLKGPGIFLEYWKRPEQTRESFVDGWFKTGDVAVFENGAYRLLGRTSVDIIKSGGDKISALEIEEVLRTHPAIAECAVVGIDDLEWGQRVCCAAELKPGQRVDLDDLREWARSRLAPHKIPKDLACVAHLPRNAMGKVVKPEVSTFFVRPAPRGRQGS